MAGRYSSNLGATLAGIGAQLPASIRQRQLDEQQRLKDEEERQKNALLMRGTQNTIAAQEEERDRQRAALEAIAKMNPNYRDPSGAPMTDEAAMNDEALQREKLITDNLPASSTIGFKKDEFEAVSNAVGALPRDKVMPSAADRFAAESDALAQYGDQEVVKQRLANLGKQMPKDQTSRESVAAMRGKEWDDISAMESGPDKDAAINSYLYKWAPGTGYNASPESIEQATRRQQALTPGAADRAAEEERARYNAKVNNAGGIDPIKTERATDLRSEFNALPEIKSVKTLQQNASKANKAYEQYKAGKIEPYEVDQSLGYFASKALDPNSVVMPGEFDRFAKGLGIAGGAQAMVQQLIGGGLKLTDAQRDAMLGIVNRAMDSGKEAAQEQYNYYKNLAEKNGTDPEAVVGGVGYIFNGSSTVAPNQNKAATMRFNPATGKLEPVSK